MDGASMLEATHRRRSLRRCVQLEAEVTSAQWEGAVPLLVTDISLHGMFVATDLTLALGEEVAVSFLPPRWPGATPFHARARVVRVSLLRRRTDRGSSAGMGLQFIALRPDQCTHMLRALRGMPPPLPRKLRFELNYDELPQGGPKIVRQHCGFRAESALLTGGRSLEAEYAAPPVSSAMSAILNVGRTD